MKVTCKKRNVEWNGMQNRTCNGMWNVFITLLKGQYNYYATITT